MLRINLITRAYNGEINGLSRYDQALYEGLRSRGDTEISICPVKQPRGRIFDRIQRLTGMDLSAFLDVYPLQLPSIDGDLGHITTTAHASALRRAPLRPLVITVHDIIHH